MKYELVYVVFNSFGVDSNCISSSGTLAYCYGKLLSKHRVISNYRRASQRRVTTLISYSARILLLNGKQTLIIGAEREIEDKTQQSRMS